MGLVWGMVGTRCRRWNLREGLVGRRGVARPGDMAAESGPATRRLGPVGVHDAVTWEGGGRASQWGRRHASPVSKGPGNSTLVGEKKEKRKRKRRKKLIGVSRGRNGVRSRERCLREGRGRGQERRGKEGEG